MNSLLTQIRETDMSEDIELVLLQRRLDSHIEDYRAYVKEHMERDLKLEAAHEKNMEAIAALTKSTQGVVDAWVTINNFQRFLKWASVFALLGIIGSWLSTHLSFIKGG